MAKWLNSDGLAVKFGTDQADIARGGVILEGSKHCVEFDLLYTDCLSATASVVGSAPANGVYDGSYGIMIPKNARILGTNILVTKAWTSSGTIGSSTLVLGLKKWSDFSTALDEDAFTATGFVGSRLDAVGERTYVEIGTTGVGSGVGTTISENGVVCVANSAHASHPYTAGTARIRIEYIFLPALSTA